ncbi:MAG: exo-alpha-sialidase [Ruminococcus sp.]|nr:exo-alpha-sialidase [Candidatus Apopatosoma intestinale]
MKIHEKPRTICDNPNSVFSYFAWPTVARLPDGSLAMACSGFRMRHVCPFGKAVICYSRDDGETWTRPAPVIDTPLDDRDAGLCVSGNRVIMTSFNNNVAFQRRVIGDQVGKSADLIRAYLDRVPTDAEERFLGSTYAVSHDGGMVFGEIHRSPVTSPHGPCALPDGRILWVGRIHDPEDKSGTPVLCCELNENEEFVPIGAIPPCIDAHGEGFACEPHAVYLPDGRLLVAIRVQRSGEHPLFTVYLTESADGGLTFSVPRPILPEEAGSPPHFLLHSSGALLLTYACRKGNYGIRARISRDLGRTFGEEILLTEHAPSPDLGYPASVERKDGTVLTVYYENNGETSTIRQLIWEP